MQQSEKVVNMFRFPEKFPKSDIIIHVKARTLDQLREMLLKIKALRKRLSQAQGMLLKFHEM